MQNPIPQIEAIIDGEVELHSAQSDPTSSEALLACQGSSYVHREPLIGQIRLLSLAPSLYTPALHGKLSLGGKAPVQLATCAKRGTTQQDSLM